jgi:hypothetical protein
MNTQLTPEQKKQRTELIIKVVGLLGVCILLGPLYLTILHGLGAIAALLVGAAALFTVTKFIPWFALKIGNARLKAIKAEAAKNPVETLQNDYLKRQSALGEFRQKIVNFSAEVQNFADKLVDFNQKFPLEAPKFKEQLSKMKKLLSLRQTKYQQAQDNLGAYELEIQKAGAIWDMGQAAAKMNEAAGMTEEDFFQKIQVETALNSITTNLNEAFADLEISLMDDDKEKAKEIYANKQKQLSDKAIDVDILSVSNNQEAILVGK